MKEDSQAVMLERARVAYGDALASRDIARGRVNVLEQEVESLTQKLDTLEAENHGLRLRLRAVERRRDR